ncbi:MAG TPA: 6-bladed beta-propeller [Bacteroidales bacterium]|nr:6-bladed beta-propeller [Bacteroidales bacterium]
MRNIIFLLLFLLVACQQNKDQSFEAENKPSGPLPHVIDLEKGLENNGAVFKLSDIADSIKFVRLEKTEESLFRKVLDVEVHGDNMFFLSFYGQKKSYVFRYNLNGEFINSIGKVGRGPAEYRACDYAIDYDRREILVLDWFKTKKILIYDYKGIFKGEHKLGRAESSQNITAIPGSRIVVYNNFTAPRSDHKEGSAIYELFDSTGTRLSVVLNPILQIPFDSKFDGEFQLNYDHHNDGAYRSGNEAYLYSRWGDTIYYTDGTEIKPAFVLYKGVYSAPLIERYRTPYKDDKPYLGEYMAVGVFITKRHVYLEQNLKEMKVVFEYDRVSGEVRSSQVESSGRHRVGYLEYEESPWFIDDLSGSGAGIRVNNRTGRNGSVLALDYNLDYFKDQFGIDGVKEDVDYEPEMLKARMNLLNSLQEDDNPVIVLVYLKDELKFEF